MLAAPLPGQEKAPPSEWEIEEEGAAFMALMSQVKKT
jgi:hypothetical protein